MGTDTPNAIEVPRLRPSSNPPSCGASHPVLPTRSFDQLLSTERDEHAEHAEHAEHNNEDVVQKSSANGE